MSTTPYTDAPQYTAAVLQWYLDNGVDETMMDTAQNRLERKVAVVSESAPLISSAVPQASVTPMPSSAQSIAGAVEIAAKAQSLEELREGIAGFDGLAIRKTAMNMVFADGNPAARVMIIGDVPDSEEDRAGRAFMGMQGMLLDKMFAAIGLDRTAEDAGHSLYMTQLLNWRPPGNRSPQQGEIDLSLPFLERHIALVKPQVLVLMGPLVTKALLGGTVSKLRGAPHIYKSLTVGGGEAEVNCFVTHPLGTLLKTPLKKREAWDDLLAVSAALK